MIAESGALQNSTTSTQCEKILAWLKAGKTITPLQALDKFSCNRLAARVNDLKGQGHDIASRMVRVVNRDGNTCRVAEYRLVGEQIDMAEVWGGV